MQLMQKEMAILQNQYKLVEADYGEDMLHLVLAQKYLAKLGAGGHFVSRSTDRPSLPRNAFETPA